MTTERNKAGKLSFLIIGASLCLALPGLSLANSINREPPGIAAIPGGTGSGNQMGVQLSSATDDGFFAIWLSTNATDGADLIVQKLDKNGTPQWGLGGVNVLGFPQGLQGDPRENNDPEGYKMLPDGRGGVFVVWQELSSRTSGWDIYAQNIDSGGTRLWTEGGVLVSSGPFNFSPDQFVGDAVVSGGSLIVAFGAGVSGGQGGFVQKLDGLTGSRLWTPSGPLNPHLADVFGVAAATAANLVAITMTEDGSGGAVLIHSDNRNSRLGVFAQRLDSNGLLKWDDGFGDKSKGGVVMDSPGKDLGAGFVKSVFDPAGLPSVYVVFDSSSTPGTAPVFDLEAARIDVVESISLGFAAVDSGVLSLSAQALEADSEGLGLAEDKLVVAFSSGTGAADVIAAAAFKKNALGAPVLWKAVAGSDDALAESFTAPRLMIRKAVAPSTSTAMIVWERGTGVSGNIMAQQIKLHDGSVDAVSGFSPAGVVISTSFAAGGHHQPSLVEDSSGAVVAWMAIVPPPSDQSDLYYTRVSTFAAGAAAPPVTGPATRIWDGESATSNLASDPFNWVGDEAPQPGDHLVFNGTLPGANKYCLIDVDGLSFSTVTLDVGFASSVVMGAASMAVNGNLLIRSGEFRAESSSITIKGDFRRTGGLFDGGIGTFTFIGGKPQVIFDPNPASFRHLVIDKRFESPFGFPPTARLASDVTVHGNLRVRGGLLDLDVFYALVEGSVTIFGTESPELDVSSGTAEIGGLLKVGEAGTFEGGHLKLSKPLSTVILHSDAEVAGFGQLSAEPAGFGAVPADSGGYATLIGASTHEVRINGPDAVAVIRGLNSSGVRLTANGLDTLGGFTLQGASFTNTGADLAALTLISGTVVEKSFSNLYFDLSVSTNINAAGVPTFLGGPVITISNASGPRAGTPFEVDPQNILNWVPEPVQAPSGTALNPQFVSVSSHSFSVVWDFISQAQYVAVLASSSTFEPASLVSSATLAQNSTFYSGLLPLTTYYFQVKLSTESDSSYALNNISTTTLPGEGAAGPPAAAVLEAVSDLDAQPHATTGAVQLRWTYPQTLTDARFHIHYSSFPVSNPDYLSAQIFVSTQVSAGTVQNFAVGGLDTGRNDLTGQIFPSYFFHVWISTGLGPDVGVSNVSNTTSSLAGTPPQGAFTLTGDPASLGSGWQSVWNGGAQDIGFGVDRDDQGNVYVVGTYFDPNGFGSESSILVRKYDPGGQPLWTRIHNSPDLTALTLDEGRGIAVNRKSGEVHVVGTEVKLGDSNIWVRKYDTNGNELWTYLYFNQAPFDKGRAIAVDGSSNVYVLGQADSEIRPDSDVLVARLGPDGNQIWADVHNSPGNLSDVPGGIAVSDQGFVYAVGTVATGSPNFDDIWIGKYAIEPAGGPLLLSSRTYNGPAGDNDGGGGIAVDLVGEIYVAGTVRVQSGQPRDLWLGRYDSGLTLLSSFTFNGSGSGDDEGFAVAVNGPDVFLAGRVDSGSFNLDLWAGRVRKDQSGNLVLVSSQTYSGDAFNGIDSGNGVALDASGNLYASGAVRNSAGGDDLWVRKWDIASFFPAAGEAGPPSAPSLVFSGGFDQPQGAEIQTIEADDFGVGVAVDRTSLGGPFVYTLGANDFGAFLVKYSSEGIKLASAPVAIPDVEESGIAIGRSGQNIFVHGAVPGAAGPSTGTIRVYDKDLNLLAERTLDGSPRTVDNNPLPPAGTVRDMVACGSGSGCEAFGVMDKGSGTGVQLVGFSGDLGRIFGSEVSGFDEGAAIAVSPATSLVYAVAIRLQSGTVAREVSLRRHSLNLAPENFRDVTSQFPEEVGGIAADASNLYITGYVTNPVPTGFTAKYSTDTLTFVSSATVENIAISTLLDFSPNIRLGPDGSLYEAWTVSQNGGDILAIRRDPATLAVISSQTFNGVGNNLDLSYFLDVADSSRVYVTGASSRPVPGLDVVTLRLDLGGELAPPPTTGPQVRVWDGETGSFNLSASNPANWVGNVLPQNGDSVVFGSTNPNSNAVWDLLNTDGSPVLLSSFTVEAGRIADVAIITPVNVGAGGLEKDGPSLLTFVSGSGSHLLQGPVAVLDGVLHLGSTTLRVEDPAGVSITSGTFEIHDEGRLEASKVENPAEFGKFRLYSESFDEFRGPPVVTSLGLGSSVQVVFSSGPIEISTGIFQNLAPQGVVIQPGVPVKISSVTFRPLLPGSTALTFLPGSIAGASASGIEFDDPNIAINIDASAVLFQAGGLAVFNSTGSRAGSLFANDPNGIISWQPDPSAVSGPPGAGTSLNPFFAEVTSHSVILGWRFVSPQAQYTAVLSTSPVFSPDSIAISETTSGDSNDGLRVFRGYDGLQPSTDYFFKVKVSTESDAAFSQPITTRTLEGAPALRGIFSGNFSDPGGAVYDGGGLDEALAAAVSPFFPNEVYVVGSSSGPSGDLDWVVVRYSSAGVLLSSSVFSTPFDDRAVAAAVSPFGDLYVIGQSGPPGQENVLIFQYSQDLRFFSQSAPFDSGGPDLARAVAVFADPQFPTQSEVIAAVQSGSSLKLLKYPQFLSGSGPFASGGEVLGTGARVDDMAVDGAGNVYTLAEDAEKLLVFKHTPGLTPAGFASFSRPGVFEDGGIAVGRSNEVYVAASQFVSAAQDDLLVLKYDPNLQFVSSTTAALARGVGAAVDLSGALYVGATTGDALGSLGFAALRYNPELVLLSSTTYFGGSQQAPVATDIAVLDSSQVYVTGFTLNGLQNDDWRTVRFDLSAGGSGIVVRAPQNVRVAKDFEQPFFFDAARGTDYLNWTWDAVPGASLYKVYRPDNLTGPIETTTFNGFKQQFTDNLSGLRLSTNTQYGISVSAVVDGTEGPLSEPAFAYTLAAPPVPQVFFVSSSTIQLGWDPNTNPPGTRYDVHVSSNFFVSLSTHISLSAGFTGTFTEIPALVPDTQYQLSVRAYNGDGVPNPGFIFSQVSTRTALGEGVDVNVARLVLLLPGESFSAGAKAGQPLPQTAGAPFSATVLAADSSGSPVGTYRGSVSLSEGSGTASPSGEILLASHTFTQNDGGSFTFAGVALRRAGFPQVRAFDQSASNTLTDSSFVQVQAGPYSRLLVLVQGEFLNPGTETGKGGVPDGDFSLEGPQPFKAGEPFSVTVYPTDGFFNNVSTDSIVQMGSSDPSAFLPPAQSIGSGIFATVTLFASGEQSLSAFDLSNAAISPVSASVFVEEKAPARLQVKASNVAPLSVEAGKESAMLRLDLWVEGGELRWAGLNVNRLGTAQDFDLLGAKVYRDGAFFGAGGAGVFDPPNDVPLSSAPSGAPFRLGSSTVSFEFPELIDFSTRTYFVTLRIANSAADGKTAGVRISTSASFLLAQGGPASQNIYPVDSALITIQGQVADDGAPSFVSGSLRYSNSTFSFLVAGSTTDVSNPSVRIQTQDSGSGLKVFEDEFPATSATIALWRFNEFGNPGTDSSAQNNTLTSASPPSSLSFARFGGGAQFDGFSQHAVSGAGLPIRTSADPREFTVQLWFKTFKAAGTLFQMADSQGFEAANFDAGIGWNGLGQLQFSIHSSGGIRNYAVAKTGFADGIWHQLTAVLRADGMALFVDGRREAANSGVSSGDSKVYASRPFAWIGAASTRDTKFNGQFFQGELDEVRVSSRALTPDETAADFRGVALRFSVDNRQSYEFIPPFNIITTGFNGSTNIETSTATAVPLLSGTSNYVVFVAQDKAGNTAVSPEFQIPVKTAADTLAPAPVGLAAVPGVLAGQVRLSWSAPGDDGFEGILLAGSRYEIQFSSEAASQLNPGTFPRWNLISVSTANVQPFTFQEFVVGGLKLGTTHFFRLRTIDEAGNPAPYSQVASALAPAFNAGGATQLVLTVPGEFLSPGFGKFGPPEFQKAGSSFTATVHAVDAGFNPISTGTVVRLISNAPNSLILPSERALSLGIGTFTVTLNSVQITTLTAFAISPSPLLASKAPASSLIGVAGGGVNVFVNASNQAPFSIQQGIIAPMLRLELRTESGSAQLLGLRVKLNGSQSNVLNAQIHRDDPFGANPGALDPRDFFMASAGFDGSDNALLAFTEIVDSQPRNYFVSLSVSASAVLGQTLGVTVVSPAGFEVSGGSMALQSIYPISSSLGTISSPSGAANDTKAPQAGISNPVDKSLVATLEYIAGSAFDDFSIERVLVSIQQQFGDRLWWNSSGGFWQFSKAENPASFSGGNDWYLYSNLFSDFLVSGSSYAVSAQALDTAGNASVPALAVVTASTAAPAAAGPQDVSAPTSFITSPVEGEIVSSLGTLSGSASDDVRVSQVKAAIRENSSGLFWDGVGWSFIKTTLPVFGCDGASSLCFWSVGNGPSSKFLVSGSSYTVFSQAIDSAGKVQDPPGQVTVFFSGAVAVSSPTALIQIPAAGAKVGDLTNISGTISGNVGEIRVLIRENRTLRWWNGFNSTFTVAVSTNFARFDVGYWEYRGGPAEKFLIAGSSYTIFAQAAEPPGFNDLVQTPAGRVTVFIATKAVAAIGDSTPPNSFIEYPGAGTSVLATLGTVSGSASDNIGVAQVFISVRRETDGFYWAESNGWIATQVSNFAVMESPGSAFTRWTYSALPDSFLTQNSSYTLSVWAKDNSGNLQSPPVTSRFTFGGTGATVVRDDVPPSAVLDLAAASPSPGQITLTWTAPGGDGNAGTASLYHLHYSTVSPVTDSTFFGGANGFDDFFAMSRFGVSDISDTPIFQEEPPPFPAGNPHTLTLTNFQPGLRYFFALKAIDGAGNVSPISNGAKVEVPRLAVSGDGSGTAQFSIAGTSDPALAPACSAVTATMTFTVGAQTLQGGALITMRIPDNWAFPQTSSEFSPGFVTFDTTSSAKPDMNVILNPGGLGSNVVGVQVNSGRLNPGEKVDLFYRNGFTPFGLKTGLEVRVRSRASWSGDLALISTIPKVNQVPGTAQWLDFTDYNFLSLGVNQVSPALVLQGRDSCGNLAAPSSAKAVTFRGVLNDFNAYGPNPTLDPTAEFSTDPKFSNTPSSPTVGGGAGLTVLMTQIQSPAVHYRSSQAGSKLARADFLDFQSGVSTFTAARFVEVAGAAIGFVSGSILVDTGTVAAATTSVTITPDNDGIADFAYIRFKPTDNSFQWKVAIASSPDFSSPVREFFGFGDPGRSVFWDGRDFSGRVLSGTFRVLLEASGGVVQDTGTLRIGVQTISISGQVRLGGSGGSGGTPASGALVNASGGGTFSSAITDPSGNFTLNGLRNGASYVLDAGFFDPATNSNAKATKFSSAPASGVVIHLQLPSVLRVAATLPTPAPFDLWGSVSANNSNFTQFGFGTLHFAAGALASDNGVGALASGAAPAGAGTLTPSTFTSISVQPDTYTVVLNLPGFTDTADARVSTNIFVGPSQTVDFVHGFTRKANVHGLVKFPGLLDFGTWVSVEMTKAGSQVPSKFGGVFVPGKSDSFSAPKLSAVYSIYGVDPGSYSLKASAFGFGSVSTGPVLVAGQDIGTSDRGGLDFPTFSQGGVISGTITVSGNTSNRGSFTLFVNAFNPKTFANAFTQVSLAASQTASSATYTIGGLDDGTYQLFTFLDGFELASSTAADALTGPQPATVSNGTGKKDLVLRSFSGRMSVTFLIGAADYENITFSVTGPGVSLSTDNVKSLDGFEGATFRVFSSSAVLSSPPNVGTGFYTVTALYKTSGKSASRTVSVVNDQETKLTLDLRGNTFKVRGKVALQGTVNLTFSSFTVVANTLGDLASNSVLSEVCTGGFQGCVNASSLRMRLFPTSFEAIAKGAVETGGRSFFAVIDSSGNYVFDNIGSGVYLLRNRAELDGNTANGAEVALVERTVVVSTSDATVPEQTLFAGFEISGNVSLPAGVTESRDFALTLSNVKGEVLQSQNKSFENSSSEDYKFSRLANGDYLIDFKDAGSPVVYSGPALVVSVGGASVANKDLQLKNSGVIRGKISLLREVAVGTATATSITPITSNNRNFLPSNFKVTVEANPWVEGGLGSAEADSSGIVFDSFDRFQIAGLVPATYDVKFRQESFGTESLGQGSVNLSPVTLSGIRVEAGQTKDVGVVEIKPSQNVTGTVTDQDGNLLSNIKVEALDGSGRTAAEALTDTRGRYTLSGLDPKERFFDLFAARREGEEESDIDHRPYSQKVLSAVDILSRTSGNDMKLNKAPEGLECKVAAADGGRLLFPDKSREGLAAAKVFLQKVGLNPRTNPIGDIIVITEPDGSFKVRSLEAADYKLVGSALNYRAVTKILSIQAGAANGADGSCVLTLETGATLSGKIVRPNSSHPNSTEVSNIAAVVVGNPSDSIQGSLVVQNRVVTSYSITGFKTNVDYELVLRDADGDNFSPEGAPKIKFTAPSEQRALTLIFKPKKPNVQAVVEVVKKFTKYNVTFEATKAIRNKKDSDNDVATMVSASSGTVSGGEISQNRKKVSIVLEAENVTASTVSVAFSAYSNLVDPDSTDLENPELKMETTTTIFIGVDAVKETSISGLDGGEAKIGGDDPTKVNLPPGALDVNASSNVKVGIQKAEENPEKKKKTLAAKGVRNPYGLRYAPTAYPKELYRALVAVPDVPAFSAFYDIFLPLGVRTALRKPTDLVIKYDTSTVTDPSQLNIYWFNPGSGEYVLQQDATGGLPEIDTVNGTIKIKVSHFSTFVLFDSQAAVITGTDTFTGGALGAFNFPNPFDLKTKTVTLAHSSGTATNQTISGTMIRVSVPAGTSGSGRIAIYNVVGEKVRTLDLGILAGGNFYYTEWDGKNDSGNQVASGVYIGEVKAGGRRKFFKMAIIK